LKQTLSLWIILQASLFLLISDQPCGYNTDLARFLNLMNMIRTIFPFILLLFLFGCNDRSYKKAEDAQDAGREFIRASLDGDYDKADFYMLQDTTNRLLMKKWRSDFERIDDATRKKYKDASILVIDVHPVNDSVTSYTYSNSYIRDTTTISIVRIKGEWLVDLKEILNHKK
jgi:hypothetical protein